MGRELCQAIFNNTSRSLALADTRWYGFKIMTQSYATNEKCILIRPRIQSKWLFTIWHSTWSFFFKLASCQNRREQEGKICSRKEGGEVTQASALSSIGTKLLCQQQLKSVLATQVHRYSDSLIPSWDLPPSGNKHFAWDQGAIRKDALRAVDA